MKTKKPSQRILINIIFGTVFSVAMGIFVWLMRRSIGGDSYLIVLLTLGIGMGVVLFAFVIVYIIVLKNEKSQEKDKKLDSGLKSDEEVPSMKHATSAASKFMNIPSSPELKPIKRVCEYCGYDSVTEGEICPECDKYAIIQPKSKEDL